jgi:pimeloyl-ACP methyl ester carboxylesterase
MRSGARTALNLITYWKMKRRAGKIGQEALAPLLRELREEDPDVRLHLIGHSFGGRLIAAAALGEDDNDPALPVTSATLLQAAFSHNGFAEDYEQGKDGYFRDVVTDVRISGPLLITYTSNDRANRWAYPAASRLARQKAAEFGGPDDVYGAIGANGAQHTPGTFEAGLLDTGDTYQFQAGRIYNLEASAYITDHGDVTGQQVGHAIVSTIATT